MSADEVTLLADIERLAARHGEAMAALRRAVAAARAADVDVAAIARAAGVTRQTVYRWATEGDKVAVPVAGALNGALEVLMSCVTSNTARDVAKGLGSHRIDAKVRRYQLAMSNVDPAAFKALDEDEHAAIHLAGLVVGVLADLGPNADRWPATITVTR